MLALAPIIERLKVSVAALKHVGGAAEFEIAAKAVPALPAAFVLPSRETGGINEHMAQLVEQEIACEFAVLLAVRNLADSTAEAAHESLRPIRIAVRTALLNWQPDSESIGCEFVNGALLDFQNGVLWWHDFYRTSYLIRST